jgi:hypothetical protein
MLLILAAIVIFVDQKCEAWSVLVKAVPTSREAEYSFAVTLFS